MLIIKFAFYHSQIFKQLKTIFMLNNFINGRINKKIYSKFFILLLTGNAACLIFYYLLHFTIFNYPIEITNAAFILIKVSAVAVVLTTCLGLLPGKKYPEAFLKKQSIQIAIPAFIRTINSVVLLLVIIFSSCKGKLPVMGVEKDMNTGLVTTYKNIKPVHGY